MPFRTMSHHINISFGTVVALTLTKDPAGSLFLLSFSTGVLFAVELYKERLLPWPYM